LLQLENITEGRWESICAAANAKAGTTLINPEMTEQSVDFDGVFATVGYVQDTGTVSIEVTRTPFWNHVPTPLEAEDKIRVWYENLPVT
jgi:hypothetical protein